MKIELSGNNFKAALSALKKSKPAKVLIEAGDGLPASAAGIAALKNAADFCIERGIGLEIAGIPPCLAPGYARYLGGTRGKVLACPAAERCFLKKNCPGIRAGYAGLIDHFRPPERGFTDLERCMLEILSRKSGITTVQVLKAAKGIKICASCSNEGEVFRAAERLIRLGLVSKEYSGGSYIWKKI